jgi:hypothetical protein
MTAASTLRRFGSILPGGRSVTLPAFDPAARAGRTIFGKRVIPADAPGRLLKRGHNSRKIGNVVQKGKWRGLPIFTLTLEERATCPRSCKLWHGCYGNNMNWAERIEHGPAFEARLALELDDLAGRHPAGFVIRLHVLGDFYSVDYVQLWADALARHAGLRVFGFTARDPAADPVGRALRQLTDTAWDRFAIRFSGADLPEKSSHVIEPGASTASIVCPAQRGLTDCCATCAFCWQSTRPVAFLRH